MWAEYSYDVDLIKAYRWKCKECGHDQVFIASTEAMVDEFAMAHAKEAHDLDPEPEPAYVELPPPLPYVIRVQTRAGRVVSTFHLRTCQHAAGCGHGYSLEEVGVLLRPPPNNGNVENRLCMVCLRDGLPAS